MIFRRVIHPIGQGGFFTETFFDDNRNEVFSAIYDCGSETQKPDLIKTYLNKWIDRYPQRRVDAVFISHLHEDHINGLDDLLSTGKVKYLFLPKITPSVVLEAYLYNYNNSGIIDNKSNTFIAKVLQNEYNNIRIIQVYEVDGDDNERSEPVPINENVLDSYRSGTVFSTNIDNIDGKGFKWLYIPFNFPLQSKIGRIEDDVFFSSVKDGNGQVDPEKLKKLIESEGIEKCKTIYAKYFGVTRHNSYSMTLFSGITPNKIKIHRDCFRCYGCHSRRSYRDECNSYRCNCREKSSPNFLYTGDFEPNNKSNRITFVELLEKRLDKLGLWNTITGIQVPHHGSRDNFNEKLYKFPCKGYFSVGSKNTYHHPNVDTIVNIQKCGCKPIVVSEDLFYDPDEWYDIDI